jgi:hypothetical protein
LVNLIFYHFEINFGDCFFRKKYFGANNGLNEAHAEVFKNYGSNYSRLWQQILF